MIHLRENYYAIEVADPQHAVISGSTITWKANGAQGRGFIVLPPGTWQIVCASKEVTRDKAHEVVEYRWCEEVAGEEAMIYVFYENGKQVYSYDPLNALAALLTSKGCDLNKTYLILKKLA
jgi:hypothetical protein